MGNATQPFDGPNGFYDLCGDCGLRLGTPPLGAIGMWMGQCPVCGELKHLANALHDFGVSDTVVEREMYRA